MTVYTKQAKGHDVMHVRILTHLVSCLAAMLAGMVVALEGLAPCGKPAWAVIGSLSPQPSRRSFASQRLAPFGVAGHVAKGIVGLIGFSCVPCDRLATPRAWLGYPSLAAFGGAVRRSVAAARDNLKNPAAALANCFVVFHKLLPAHLLRAPLSVTSLATKVVFLNVAWFAAKTLPAGVTGDSHGRLQNKRPAGSSALLSRQCGTSKALVSDYSGGLQHCLDTLIIPRGATNG